MNAALDLRRAARARVAASLLALLCGVLPATLSASAAANSPAAQSAGLMLKKDSDQSLWVAGLQSLAIAALALSAAAGGLLWLRKRYRAPAANDRGSYAPVVLSSRRASQKTVLHVVQWEDRVYLLAENSGATQLVDQRDVGKAAAPAAAPGSDAP
jgi:hypothetical protein